MKVGKQARLVLCEDCGYALTGLSPEDACPECGRSVASSLPGARRGSAWQVRRSVGAWFSTLVAVVRGPRDVFAVVRAEPTYGLLFVNLALCAGIVFGFSLVEAVLERSAIPDRLGDAVRATAFSLSFGVASAVIFGGLTAVEVAGVRIWSARLGRKLPYSAIWSVCAHASYGWLVSAVLVGIGWALAPVLHFRLTDLGQWWLTAPVALVMLIVPGAFLGMLVFETLVFLGVRRCRFINVAEAPVDGSEDAQAA